MAMKQQPDALSGRIEQLLRQHGPQTAAQLAQQLAMASSALEPLLQLLEQRGRLRSRLADLRSRNGQPQRFYLLGAGERLRVRVVDAGEAQSA